MIFEKCYESKADIPECTKRLVALLKDQGISKRFRMKGAELALGHSPDVLKELCVMLSSRNEVGGQWGNRCGAADTPGVKK